MPRSFGYRYCRCAVGGQQFKLGGLVLHRGKAYVMRGYSRRGESRQYVDLEDTEGGARFTVPVEEAFAVPLAADETPPDIPRVPRAEPS